MRRVLPTIAAILLVLALAVYGAGRLGWLQGERPRDLGVRDGRLKPPSPTPNSVSSQASLYPNHPMRERADIAPLPLKGDARTSIAALRALVETLPGARVVEQRDDYLYAEFTTPTLRFVDDVEFWADAANGRIEVRSSSRIGRGDRGVNRERIEEIRARWAGAG
jgi:uncharacterized protein (DUF1499 family)